MPRYRNYIVQLSDEDVQSLKKILLLLDLAHGADL